MECAEWEQLPRYSEVVQEAAEVLGSVGWPEPIAFLSYLSLGWEDLGFAVVLGAVWVAARQLLFRWALRPLSRVLGLSSHNAKKFPECIWRLTYYTSICLVTIAYLVYSGTYCAFVQPSIIYRVWSEDAQSSWGIYLLLQVQVGFYIGAIFCMLVLDPLRKDWVVQLAHHVLTIILVVVPYGLRLHSFVPIVLFFHDICDVPLEFSKLNVYMRVRYGKHQTLHENLSNYFFVFFVYIWFHARLYWIPLKAVHILCFGALEAENAPRYMIVVATCIVFLQVIHIIWTYYIIKVLYRVLDRQSDGLIDIREHQEDDVSLELDVTKCSNVVNNNNNNTISSKVQHKIF